MLDGSLEKRVRAMFHAYDRDHNKSLDEREIAELLVHLGGMSAADAYYKTTALLAAYDTDMSRTLDESEFQAAVFADRELWSALLGRR